jgi:haloalkane dehalogenase
LAEDVRSLPALLLEAASAIPKLLINAKPGSILVGTPREFCWTWPNQNEVTVTGRHFIQEDSFDEIGRPVADWVATLP